MSGPADRFAVGVVVARRPPVGAWASHVWLPRAVLPRVPEAAPGTALGHEGTDELFYAGLGDVLLDRGATAHYRDNLVSGRPSLWVLLAAEGDAVRVWSITADPYEGEAYCDIGGIVEAVPMPPEIAAGVAEFVAAFHRETPFLKRSRDRADPDALARRAPAALSKREGPK